MTEVSNSIFSYLVYCFREDITPCTDNFAMGYNPRYGQRPGGLGHQGAMTAFHLQCDRSLGQRPAGYHWRRFHRINVLHNIIPLSLEVVPSRFTGDLPKNVSACAPPLKTTFAHCRR